jgi:hypothetical protein
MGPRSIANVLELMYVAPCCSSYFLQKVSAHKYSKDIWRFLKGFLNSIEICCSHPYLRKIRLKTQETRIPKILPTFILKVFSERDFLFEKRFSF